MMSHGWQFVCARNSGDTGEDYFGVTEEEGAASACEGKGFDHTIPEAEYFRGIFCF
jgi:hypothetical protein